MNITQSSSVLSLFYSELNIYKCSSEDKVTVFYPIKLAIYIETKKEREENKSHY